MGRDLGNPCVIRAAELVPNAPEAVVPILPGQRHTFFREIEKATFTVDYLCYFWHWPVSNQAVKANVYII